MMKIEQAKGHEKTANKIALQAEKEKDAAEKTLEELKRQLQPKRTCTDDDDDDAHEMLAEVDYWDLRDHRQQATHVQNRRNVQVGSRNNQQKPHTGKDGFLHHTRLGLVGWIQYWCCGDAALAVVILVVLINTLGLTELVSDALGVPRHYAKRPFSFVLSRPFGQKTNSRSHHQQGFGIATNG